MTKNKLIPILQLILAVVVVELVGFCSSLLAGEMCIRDSYCFVQ